MDVYTEDRWERWERWDSDCTWPIEGCKSHCTQQRKITKPMNTTMSYHSLTERGEILSRFHPKNIVILELDTLKCFASQCFHVRGAIY